MIRSMTGYGISLTETPECTVKTEIKSLNSKFFELRLKLPSSFNDKEVELRNMLESRLNRGKVDITVNMKYLAIQKTNKIINTENVIQYFEEINEICKELHIEKLKHIDTILNLPDVFSNEFNTAIVDENGWKIVIESVNEALKQMDKFRTDEGAKLEKEMLNYLNIIRQIATEISITKDDRIAKIKEKLSSKLAELQLNDINQERFEQELVYYLEKLDITEELDRLSAHIDYFKKTILEDDNGRKLNFITQEIGREINTIGSKANDTAIQQKVVMMKNELEKIRQQLANIL